MTSIQASNISRVNFWPAGNGREVCKLSVLCLPLRSLLVDARLCSWPFRLSPLTRSRRRLICLDVDDVVSCPSTSPRTAGSLLPSPGCTVSASKLGIFVPLWWRGARPDCPARQTPEIRNPSEVEGCHAVLLAW